MANQDKSNCNPLKTTLTLTPILLQEIDDLYAAGKTAEQIPENLTAWSSALFSSLPTLTQGEFLLERESGGEPFPKPDLEPLYNPSLISDPQPSLP